MFKWLLGKPAPKSEDKKAEPARDGFFSTAAEPLGISRAELIQNAISRSIQKTAEKNMVTLLPDGTRAAMDDNIQAAKLLNSAGLYECIPDAQLAYFGSQGFIGYQVAAIISQNWLVDKACTMPGRDAVRHGYDITVNDGSEISPEVLAYMRKMDRAYKIADHCVNFIRFGRIFGVRVAMFDVDGIDYSLPFNIDGVRPGSYKGISQIDPYWITPELDAQAAANPASRHFYEPTWWRINGKRVHRTHLVIMRNGDLPDILKPTYMYGGIPVPQKIAERVYAAERTANEAPLLAMTKRLTTLKVDMTQAITNYEKFQEKMSLWTQLMNNFGVKVYGGQEEVNQFETSLADLDAVIMTQYQIVAAASDVPATKLLGTTPKGFNATGEYEEASYHELLESMQEHDLTPLVERHHLLLMKSVIAPKFGIDPIPTEINWNPVDSPTADELADINLKKAQADSAWANAGAIDGVDIRGRLINDKDSGYNGIAEIVPGQIEAPDDNEEEAGTNVTDESLFNAKTGTYAGAQLITNQKFISEDKVREKLNNGDFDVTLSPIFEVEGRKYRAVIDGHHSLEAALRAGKEPIFTVVPGAFINAVTRQPGGPK